MFLLNLYFIVFFILLNLSLFVTKVDHSNEQDYYNNTSNDYEVLHI